MFSPYYARARGKGHAAPENHIALNVALYGKRARAWAMTERRSSALSRCDDWLQIGPSALRWDGDGLRIDIDEIAFPVLGRIKGTVRITPSCLPAHEFQLDAAGTQIWQPIAPLAHIEVALTSPAVSWSGGAYFDHNRGSRPLESAFRCWDWSRQATQESTRILYDVSERDGEAACLALEVRKDGSITHLEAPARASLPSGKIWRVARGIRCDEGREAHIIETLEDTPFYTRSIVSASLWGDTTPSMHESLDLDRFRSPIVKAMLPFRMPRKAF